MITYIITENQLQLIKDICIIRESMRKLGAMLTEDILIEDKQDILKKKYVGIGPKKITQQQFNQFYESAGSNRILRKYADVLLHLAVNSSSKDRFFSDKDYNIMVTPNGILSLYITKLPIIRRMDPKFVNLIEFKTLENFKNYMSRFFNKSGEQINNNTADELKLQENGINKIGEVDGYKVFEVDMENITDRDAAWRAYRNFICAGKTRFCTAADFEAFTDYLMKGNLFIFVNPTDPQAPYQFHYESEQFVDKDDIRII